MKQRRRLPFGLLALLVLLLPSLFVFAQEENRAGSGDSEDSDSEPVAPKGRPAEARTDVHTGKGQATRTNAKTAPDVVFVQHAVDGDTLRLADGRKIRLLGVDTPETKHPKKKVECFGPEASDFTKKSVNQKWVRIRRDKEEKDRYGRTLGYVYREEDEFFLNLELVRAGLGVAYTRYPFEMKEEFVKAEETARVQGKGLWGACVLDPQELEKKRENKPGKKKKKKSG